MPLSDDPGSNAWKRLHEEPDFAELLESFREIPELGVFNGQLQFVPGQASRMKYETLGTWLLERAREIGSTEAVNDLSKFIEANEIPFQRFSAVEGLRLQRQCNVQPGVRLLPWTDVNQTKSMRYIDEFWHRQFRFPTAAVVGDLKEPKKLFFAPDSDSNPIFDLGFDDPELILCAGLFGPAAPVVLASWVEFPTWFPRSGVSWSFTGPTDSSQDRGWPEKRLRGISTTLPETKNLTDARTGTPSRAA